MTTNQKIICAVLLFGVWIGFAVSGQAPVSELVSAIRDALVALGVFTATLANPKE